MRSPVLCVLSVCVNVAVCTLFTAEVRLPQGTLRGLRSLNGQNHYFGIPYATSSRFQPPGEPPRWEGVFSAVERARHCAQAVWRLRLTQEDCLQLDVHTPPPPSRPRPLPVLLFIHGGGYYYGTKAHYDPDYLVAKNVVVVVINYRLGVFGFLCANGVANLGLKDQVAAIKWIRKNIAAFGGDPDNVTIAGQSAGASSAAMHMLSKSSAGLFHKLILMSGTSTTPWAFNVEPLRPAFEDAAKLGRVKTESDILRVLSAAPAHEILSACADVSTNSRYFKYAPCVDTNTSEPFFHDTPYGTIRSGNFSKVPVMIGYTDIEGMLFYGLHDDQTLKEFNDNFVEHLPSVFSWQPENVRRKLGKKVRNHYFGKKRIDRSAVKEVVDYYSDWIAYGAVEAFAETMVKQGLVVYSYVFGYQGGRNFAKRLFGRGTGLEGASHSDDIFYVFKPGGLQLPMSERDRHFIGNFTTLIANFMTYGDPTPAGGGLGVRWAARAAGGAVSLRLAARPRPQAVRARHAGGYLRRLLCRYALPGYAACD